MIMITKYQVILNIQTENVFIQFIQYALPWIVLDIQ